MSFASTTEWESRSTGDNSNGGGWDISSTGTDYSQQDAPQVTFTDLVIDATTNTKCTSAAHPFTSAHVGNIINITSGTGFTVQRVQVVSVAGSTATCDKSLGTLSSTGGNGKLGGGLIDPGLALSLHAAGNWTWVKYHATNQYAISSGTQNIANGRLKLSSGATNNRAEAICGYDVTHGDNTGNRPYLFNTQTTGDIINVQAPGAYVYNLKIDINSKSVRGINLQDGWNGEIAMNNVVINGSGGVESIRVEGGNIAYNNEVTGFGGTSTIGIYLTNSGGGAGHAIANRIHDWSGTTAIGINLQTYGVCAIDNIIYNESTPGTTIGILFANGLQGAQVRGNSIYGCHRGIQMTGGLYASTISNNILYGNDVDVNDDSATAAGVMLFNNAYGTTNIVNDPKASFNRFGNVTLTAGPFTSPSTGDLSLNSTTGGGAAAKGIGGPAPYISTPTLNNARDAGAVQSAGGGGGSTNYILHSPRRVI